MDARLSIWSSYYRILTIEEAVERFIQNGIYCSELSDEHGLDLLERSPDYIGTGKKFAQFLKEHNFEMSQGHLWLGVKICSDENAIDVLCRWIDMYEAIGIKNMVLHCDVLLNSGLSAEETISRNIEKLRQLAKHIKDKDITICLENLRKYNRTSDEFTFDSVDMLLDIIDRVGSNRFGICLDTGHLNMTLKNQRDFILKAGAKLRALHIANNEGEKDEHHMPFTRGTVDFTEVIQALREIDYNGLFNLEIPGESQIPLPLRDEKIKFIKSGYDYLMNLCENK